MSSLSHIAPRIPSSGKVLCIATVYILPAHVATFRSLIAPVQEVAKGEEGVVGLRVSEAMSEVGKFVCYEEYIGQEGIDTHCATPQVQALFGAAGEIVDEARGGVKIEFHEEI